MKIFFEHKGVKQKYVAEKTGIKEATLSMIFTGKRKCSLEEYVKLCRLAECDFDFFIDDVEKAG